jgi:hypothetical protein
LRGCDAYHEMSLMVRGFTVVSRAVSQCAGTGASSCHKGATAALVDDRKATGLLMPEWTAAGILAFLLGLAGTGFYVRTVRRPTDRSDTHRRLR